jgi:hypothetical protein
MKVFTYDCVTLADVCEQNTLDYGHVIEEISHSDISFGTNEDTLISKSMLEQVLDITIDFGGLDDSVLISLGS